MTKEKLKEGVVTYFQSDALITLAEKWLLEYLMSFGPKRPGDMEDDFCGKPGILEMMSNMQGRWRASPFYQALARLIDKGKVCWWKDEDDTVWYKPTGPLPMAELMEHAAAFHTPAVGAA